MTGRPIALSARGGVRSAHLLDAREAPPREVARQNKEAATTAAPSDRERKYVAGDDAGVGRLVPTACPFCRSSQITTASEKVDSSTYWRCETCGQVWNVERLRASPRHGYEGR